MLMEGRVGNATAGDGDTERLRLDHTAAQVVTDGHAHFQEAVRCGGVFTAGNPAAGTTVAAGGAVTNPLLALYNPLNSARNYVIWKTSFYSISGTAAAGIVSYYINGGQAAGAGAANVTPVNNLTALTSGTNAKAYAAVTNSLANAPLFLRPMLIYTANISTEAIVTDLLDGEIVLQPGGVFAISPVGAGTTWVVTASVVWEEVPV